MIREAQAIRELFGWADPVNIITIRAYLVGNHNVDISIDASVEVKKGRAIEDEEAEELISKKKPPSSRGIVPSGKSLTNCTCQKEEMHQTFFFSPKKCTISKGEVGRQFDQREREGKKSTPKGKGKTLAYKLQLDIESSIDLKGILEERILDAKIEFTLKEALGIAKKDFHEFIIDIIKRKRQMTTKTVVIRVLDTRIIEDKKKEIGQVFALMYDHMDGQDKTPSPQIQEDMGIGMEEFIDDELESEVL